MKNLFVIIILAISANTLFAQTATPQKLTDAQIQAIQNLGDEIIDTLGSINLKNIIIKIASAENTVGSGNSVTLIRNSSDRSLPVSHNSNNPKVNTNDNNNSRIYEISLKYGRPY